MVIICRSLQGVFNGNIGITKAMVAEITDATNITQAFSFMPLVWGVYDSVEYVHHFHLFTKPIADWFFKPGDRWHLLSSSRYLAIILWENPIPSQLSLPFAHLCLTRLVPITVLWWGAGLSIDIDMKPPLATTLGVTLSSNPTPSTNPTRSTNPFIFHLYSSLFHCHYMPNLGINLAQIVAQSRLASFNVHQCQERPLCVVTFESLWSQVLDTLSVTSALGDVGTTIQVRQPLASV